MESNKPFDNTSFNHHFTLRNFMDVKFNEFSPEKYTFSLAQKETDIKDKNTGISIIAELKNYVVHTKVLVSYC